MKETSDYKHKRRRNRTEQVAILFQYCKDFIRITIKVSNVTFSSSRCGRGSNYYYIYENREQKWKQKPSSINLNITNFNVWRMQRMDSLTLLFVLWISFNGWVFYLQNQNHIWNGYNVSNKVSLFIITTDIMMMNGTVPFLSRFWQKKYVRFWQISFFLLHFCSGF